MIEKHLKKHKENKGKIGRRGGGDEEGGEEERGRGEGGRGGGSLPPLLMLIHCQS